MIDIAYTKALKLIATQRELAEKLLDMQIESYLFSSIWLILKYLRFFVIQNVLSLKTLRYWGLRDL
jgi:type II restriction/modification system DNA methylase subunit YeeA